MSKKKRTMINITRAEFGKWLAKKNVRRAGFVENDMRCPLACFIRAKTNLAFVQVTGLMHENPIASKSFVAYDRNEGVQIRWYPWMSQFVHGIDALKTKQVSGSKALEILNKIR